MWLASHKMDKTQESEFRRLVLYLADHLTDTETNKLVYIYDLPREYKDKQPLIVLELMHNWDLFSASKPDSLAKIMKDIKRVDLAKAVEKHAKKTRKAGAKSRAAAGLKPEADPSFLSSLQAKLEVLSIQSSIGAHVVDDILEMVRPTSMQRLKEVVEEIKSHVENFRWLSKSAQVLLDIQPNLKRDERKLEFLPSELKGKFDSCLYEQWFLAKGGAPYSYIDPGPQPAAGLQRPSRQNHQSPPAQMVTGHSATQKAVHKPPIHPKPSKAVVEGFRHSAGPRDFPTYNMLELPIRREESVSVGSQSSSSSRSVRSSTSSASGQSDYVDGSSITQNMDEATGTGDSGFGEGFLAPLKSSVAGTRLSLQLGPGGQVTGTTCRKTAGYLNYSDIIAGEGDDEEDDAYEDPDKDSTYVNVL